MQKILLPIDEKLLEKARAYAKKHHLSLNELIHMLLDEKFREDQSLQLEACFQLMDSLKVSSDGISWKREDLYLR